jgi:ABC-2 type transport system permease protein
MGKIFLQSLKDRFVSLLAYSVGSLLLMLMYVAAYPAVLKQAEQLNTLIKNYPEGLMKAIGVGTIDFSVFGNFIATEQFSFTWPLLVIFLTVSCAAGWISGEIERRTIELTLAQPVSRTKLFFGRYLGATSILAVFCLISIGIIAIFAELGGYAYSKHGVLALFVDGCMFGLAIQSLAFLFSALFSERSKTYVCMTLVLIVMYALNILATLKDSFHSLGYVSFFHYFTAQASLTQGSIDRWAYLAYLGTALVATGLAVTIFSKRDITA